jgi:hypothetical protein
MRLSTFIVCVVVVVSAGCANIGNVASSGHHMTESQVVALAKNVLPPVTTGEQWKVGHARFEDGIWEVEASVGGMFTSSTSSFVIDSPFGITTTTIKIRDVDGKVEEPTSYWTN